MPQRRTMRRKRGHSEPWGKIVRTPEWEITWAKHLGEGRKDEDRHSLVQWGNLTLAAVWDGHGIGRGDAVSDWVSTRFPVLFRSFLTQTDVSGIVEAFGESFEHVLDNFPEPSLLNQNGTTGTVAVLSPTHVVVAHVGDSPAIYWNPADPSDNRYTVDHDWTNVAERQRVLDASGSWEYDKGGQIWRVGGDLMISRSLGDRGLKGISEVPDINVWDRKPGWHLALMTDGLVDLPNGSRMSPTEVVQTLSNPFEALRNQTNRFFKGEYYWGDNVLVLRLKPRPFRTTQKRKVRTL